MAEEEVTRHAKNFKDLTGQRFSMLVAIGVDFVADNNQSVWNCLCDCGRNTKAWGGNLKRGFTKSCGCHRSKWKSENPAAMLISANQREYTSWRSAKQRCYSSNYPHYESYGGRGITMSEEWINSFAQFLSDMGARPHETSLDRMDNDGPYCKANCRWATQQTQCRNQRKTIRITHDGQTLTLPEWSALTGIRSATLRARHKAGLPLFAPSRKYRKR